MSYRDLTAWKGTRITASPMFAGCTSHLTVICLQSLLGYSLHGILIFTWLCLWSRWASGSPGLWDDTLKPTCSHLDEFVITGGTGSYQNDNFQRQPMTIRRLDISASVHHWNDAISSIALKVIKATTFQFQWSLQDKGVNFKLYNVLIAFINSCFYCLWTMCVFSSSFNSTKTFNIIICLFYQIYLTNPAVHQTNVPQCTVL